MLDLSLVEKGMTITYLMKHDPVIVRLDCEIQ